jgi:hypothetical protein
MPVPDVIIELEQNSTTGAAYERPGRANDKVLAIGEARRGSCPKRPKNDDRREARIVEEVPAHPAIGLIDFPATPAVRALHGSAVSRLRATPPTFAS